LLDNLIYRFQNNFNIKLSDQKKGLELLESKVDSFNIDNVLKRGFSIIKQNDRYITRKKNLEIDKSLEIKFYDGQVKIK